MREYNDMEFQEFAAEQADSTGDTSPHIPEKMSVDERQAIRRKKRLRRRRRFIAIVLIIILGTAGFGILTYIDKKGLADVETIVVEGNVYYDTVSVLETSGAVTGEGLLSLSSKKIRSNLETLPYIKSVKITKKLPHTLKITVAERIPEYAAYFGGFFVYLDDEMVMLEKRNEAGDLKIVEGFVPEKFEPGEVFAPEDSKNFSLAVKLADSIKEKGLTVYKVSFRNGLMRVYFSKNIVCEGTYDNLMKYITELNEILYSLSTQKIERATIYIGDNGYISFSPKIE
ncbi:MAG: FtsQ-type POTRA domain-containing protein [Bacillota bacterium]|nr:FtsQ-type POTRA domain-containing protein [Bacillota bacterium]